MMKKLLPLLFIVLLSACSKQEVLTHEQLSIEEINYIKSLGLLEEGEKIIKFSSNMDIKTSGNFYSNKRLASYWQYPKSPKNDYIKYAYYEDIDSIGFNKGGEVKSPSIIVFAKGNRFKVAYDLNDIERDTLFKEFLEYWETKK